MSLVIAILVLLNLNVFALKVHADFFQKTETTPIEEQASEQPSLLEFLDKAIDFVQQFEQWIEQKSLEREPAPNPPDKTPPQGDIIETKGPRAPPVAA